MRDTFKQGETYRIVYSPAKLKRAGNVGLLWSLQLPDGKIVAMGAQDNINATRELLKKQ